MIDRIVASYMKEMPNSLRSKVNRDLERVGMDGNIRFRTVGKAINTIHGVLGEYGIDISEVLSAHRFSRDSGTTSIDLEYRNEDDPYSPVPIRNSVLFFQWHKFVETDTVEVVAYLS